MQIWEIFNATTAVIEDTRLFDAFVNACRGTI